MFGGGAQGTIDELRREAPPRVFEEDDDRPVRPLPMEVEQPESILSEGVRVEGRLVFERFIRIDGYFEGEIESSGKIVIGPTGVVKSSLDLREAIIEGVVEGNITVSGRLELRGEARVIGDVTAKLLSIDEGVTIVGRVCVQPNEAGGGWQDSSHY